MKNTKKPVLLALETTEKTGSVALFRETELWDARELDASGRSAQTLCPAIHRLFNDWKVVPGDVDVVAVTVGPGSFTGLRVGVVTAKMFAYAVGARVVGVDTLQAMALGVSYHSSSPATVAVALDAQRGDVVAQCYTVSGTKRLAGYGMPQPVSERRLVKFSDFCRDMHEQGIPLASPLLVKQAARLPSDQPLTDAVCWQPRAEFVGRIALLRVAADEYDDLWTLEPVYSRVPAACENR